MSQTNSDIQVEAIDKNFQTNMNENQQLDRNVDKQKNKNQKVDNEISIPDKKIQNQLVDNSSQQSGEQPINFMNNNKVAEKEYSSDQDQSEKDEEQSDFKVATQILPKQNQKDRLIEQNIKLKAQIYELAKQLDQIVQNDRLRKKKVSLNVIQQEDELIRDKKLELKKQQIEIMQVKSKIFVAKRQLQSVYNNITVTEKENKNKSLQATLKALERERQGLMNMNNEQIKALKIATNQDEYGAKIDQVNQKYAILKSQTRKTIVQIGEEEKKLLKTHQTYITKLEKLKDIQSKLALNKQKSKTRKSTPQQMITEDMLKSLQAQIKQAQIKKKQGEKLWQEKIKVIDLEMYKKKIEQERRMLILRQKEKQLKLGQLKIRQLKKMVRDTQQAQKQLKNKDVDMAQYRHKRNIRYLDK